MKASIILVLGLTAFVSYSLAEDCECGIQNGVKTRIVRGKEAKKDRYPWYVSLMIKQGGGMWSSCGGSIISDRTILTAAHCVAPKTDPGQVTAVLGAHDDSHRIYTTKAQLKLSVKSVHIHPDYNKVKGAMHFDIALIKLSKPIVFDKKVGPVCIPTKCDTTVLSAVGFGRQDKGRSLVDAKKLYDVEMELHDAQTCQREWGSVFQPEFEVCAGGQKGTCQGDSGGPVFYVNRQTGHSMQCAVVSFGTPGCSVERLVKPAVYEQVPAHLDWIEQHTRGDKFCRGPSDTPAFTKKNIAQTGKSYKVAGGQTSAQENNVSSPSRPSGLSRGSRPSINVGDMGMGMGMGMDMGNMPPGAKVVRVTRTMGPDGKVTEKIDGEMSPEMRDMLNRMRAGNGMPW